MKHSIEVNGVVFNVSAKLMESGIKFPNSKKDDKTLHNKFRVTVSTEIGRISFDFYGSHQDYVNGQKTINRDDAKHALCCFVSEACSGNDTFINFCSELGYDEDSRTAERIYKACVKSLAKFEKITDANIYDVADAINA